MKNRTSKDNTIVRKKVQTRRFNADIRYGLNSDQVNEYFENGWSNEPVEPPSKTVPEIIKSNLFTYFNLVFAVLAALLILAGSFRNLTFLPVILANLFIGIIQEIRAKNTLDKLSVLNAPKALVVREGRQFSIPAEELVLDDIVIFKAGNQICADAIVVDGEVSVNESLLTGESDEISKKPGDELMSGSFIVSGECYARLDKVGEDSYISKLTLEAKAMNSEEQSEMIRVLDKLVGVVGILIIPIGLLLFGQQFFFSGASFSKSITSMVAAVIGMIPEGLYLLASVALVVSVMRLASKKVLVHDMKCIETLARVNVLCVDKTGTITENTMEVNGEIPMDGYDSQSMAPLKQIISDFASAMSSDNITMKAMKDYFNKPSGRKAVSVSPFSSQFKYSGAAFEDGSYVLGAPEFVLREDYDNYREQIEQYSSEGYRVLVFGIYDGVIDGKALTGKVTPLGLVLLSNPIRKEAPETFKYFENQGVEIKVISGDNPVTVSQVALQAGIANADNYIDASTLTTDEAIEDAVLRYTVFGRVTPDQKRKFVRALKKAGRTVAMTGDGVNDVLALKDADCSVAMASGSDAAAQASQLVLLDSNFACMPSVVMEGRRVVNNIERSASLFLVKNIFSFLLSLFSVCFMINYPLEPSQISLISMFTIGVPAFFLALQPNKNIIQGHFLSNVLIKALPAGITDFLVVGALVVFGQVFEVGETDISTACTMLLAIVGFVILYNISKPMNALRWCVWGGCIVGLLGCSIYLGDLFAMRGMSTKCIMLFVVFAIITEPALRYSTILIEKIGRKIVGWIEKRRKAKIIK
ncbi:cation-translocating P-type ATPase [Eubacterium ventriosum]|uniref:HAD family hydrolase n=1 Tax=Eubacterium ventriosum TaxID=39496 RepID=A0A413TA42_9FIRM|nr:cation-translocating P-type ATPase [Eubacterium ventriosum]MEE0854217.1 cation-translocating P-type ATPase [Eubacterium ventriosum]RHA81810.1 HAD family hydrolase [Eubacterium ventriosum]